MNQVSTKTSALHQQEVQSFRQQMAFLLFWKQLVLLGTFWCFVWGTVVLVLRLTLNFPALWSLWGAVGFVPVLVAASLRVPRLLPSEGQVRAFLDSQNQLGGMLMASEETELGKWKQGVNHPSVPSIRWRGGRAVSMALTSFLFVGATFLLPQRYIRAHKPNRLNIRTPVNRLNKQIRVLKNQKAITARQAKQWQKKLEQIQKKAKATDPARTWQALDHLRKKAKEAARKAAEKKAAASEQIRKAARLSRFVKEQQKLLKGKHSQKARNSLAQAMKRMHKRLQQASRFQTALKMNKAMRKKLAKLMKAMKSGKLSPQQLKALQKMMQKLQGQLSKSAMKLAKARLISPKSLSMKSLKMSRKKTAGYCKGGGQGKGKGMGKGMGKGKGKKPGVMVSMPGATPGRGGLSRGPGHTGITWQKGKEIKGVRFKAKALPPGKALDLKKSRLMGISLGAPDKSKTPVTTVGGGLKGVRINQNTGRRFRILPQYRGTVQRYFQRKP